MNQNKVSASIAIIAVSNGTTLNGYVRVENGPLVQAWAKGSKTYTPDWEAMSEDKRPVVGVVLRDSSTGRLLAPLNQVFKYNGVALEFGPDNLCTTPSFEGMFKKVTGYNFSIDSQSFPTTVIRVMKNLVPISGYDNDRITVSGTAEVGGHTVEFKELPTEVVIQESSGKQYDLIIGSKDGNAIDKPDGRLVLDALLYNGGALVNELGDITLQWKKLKPGGDQNMGTQKTQTITVADIDGSLTVCCEAIQGSKVLDRAFYTVFDYTDPILAEFVVSGLSSAPNIYEGETATITPRAFRRGDLNKEEVPVPSWTFATKDVNNNDFTLTGKPSHTFEGKSFELTYTDATRAQIFRVVATNTNELQP